MIRIRWHLEHMKDRCDWETGGPLPDRAAVVGIAQNMRNRRAGAMFSYPVTTAKIKKAMKRVRQVLS